MTKRAQPGDIIEVSTAKGLAYVQYTHQHPTHGGLIRVFDAVFESRPSGFAEIVKGPVRFSTFFPVRAAVHRGIFKVVGHEVIAPQNAAFPIFRIGIEDPKSKKVALWWFWDGEREWAVGQITSEQRKMPLRAVWNATMLIERIETGWTPQDDPR